MSSENTETLGGENVRVSDELSLKSIIEGFQVPNLRDNPEVKKSLRKALKQKVNERIYTLYRDAYAEAQQGESRQVFDMGKQSLEGRWFVGTNEEWRGINKICNGGLRW